MSRNLLADIGGAGDRLRSVGARITSARRRPHLAMRPAIQYSTVIQGAQDPIYAYVYNDAPTGSDPLIYQVTTTYPIRHLITTR